MIERIKSFYVEHPLRAILTAAFLIRLVAVIFSKGYGMHDDHFLTVEPAQSWADSKFDYNDWLDQKRASETLDNPSGHSLLYPGALFVFFKAASFVGMDDPQVKMFFVRLLHALFSLLIVHYGYLIVQKLKGQALAKKTGWLLALFWFLPVAGVHNFVEVVCIPALLASSWYLLLYDDHKKVKYLLYSAIWISIAFAIRFQVLFFFGGVGLYFLFRWRILHGIYYLFFTALFYFITQLPDFFIWGKAFVLNQNYIDYNFKNAEEFINHPFYQYFLLVSVFIIPPLSLFFWAGYFKDIKKTLPIFLPSLCFLLIHSYFPNKQERFILPFIPYLIILGMMGWHTIEQQYDKWFTNKKLVKGVWIFFWVINIAGLILLTPSYNKKSRVESMYYLSQQEDANTFIMESTHDDFTILPPLFYFNKWVYYEMMAKGYNYDRLYEVFGRDYKNFPHYIIFIEDKQLEERISRYEKEMNQELEQVQVCESGYLDKLVFWLNPRNKNFTFFIYRIKPF
jgi:hypothetical protein